MALAYSRADANFAFGYALCVLGRGVVGFYCDNVLACSGRSLDACHSGDVGTGGVGYGRIRCIGYRRV